MSGLLGGITDSGSILDPKRLWRAAGCQQLRSARMLVAKRSNRAVEIVSDGEEVPANCAFLLPADGHALTRDAIWVGLHGSIFNLPELAQQRGLSYHDEYSDCPTEVVRQSYKYWGASCFSRFRGSFACAIVDLRNGKLLLARDHVGSKSLFFSTRCGFYFASTIKALLEISGVPCRPNLPILQDWLLDLPTCDPTQTFFAGIVRLPPATWLELNLCGPMNPSVTEFWPIRGLVDRGMTRDDAERCLQTLLAESIELSTRDKRVAGITLSGGLDSSVILATLRKSKGGGYPIHSFTFISDTPDSRAEESRARAVTELCDSESHLVRYDCQRIPDEIDALILDLEEPVASPVLFAHRELYRVAQAVGVQDVLSGHGADSLFAGSNSHLVAMAASLCRRGRLIRAGAMLANAASGNRLLQLLKSLVGASLPHRIKSVLRPRTKPDWLIDDWFPQQETSTRNSIEGRATNIRIQLMRELQTSSLPHTLRFEERASEAFFVFARSPFLAPEVVEFALSLSEELLIGRDGHTKSILRSASRDMLPGTILESRERIGFPVPADKWLRSLAEWAADELTYTMDLPFINAGKVDERWELFRHSENNRDWYQAMKIWRLIFLIRWAKVFRMEF